MRKLKNENGLLSLEASIVVTIFIFLMLYMYSFFVVFEARNEMAHVLLASTNSLSLDTYQTEKIENSGTMSQMVSGIFDVVANEDNPFISHEKWYMMKDSQVNVTEWNGTIYVDGTDSSNLEADDYGNAATTSGLLGNAIKERFIAYLGAGDEDVAKAKLERYHIVGGINGLDFSGSKISSGKLYVVVRYTIEYEFNMFGLGTLDMQQSACSRLWK